MAVAELGEMLVRYKADVSDLATASKHAKEEIGSVGKKAEESSGGLKKMFGSAVSMAAGFGLFNLAGNAVGFLHDQLGSVFEESRNAQAGMAQTNQVLKSTHDVSGMTAQAIGDLATKYSHLTMFSDDTVQSAENMLLTFTNIGKNVFPQATQTALDMSQALGQDVKSSAIQLGKALGDPLTGFTALQRVGVTFSEQQKESIKTFMAHNNIMGAQKVILGELSKEFGGSATAAGKTFDGQMAILGQRMDDLRQNIGDALMPIFSDFIGYISSYAMPLLSQFSDWFLANGIPVLKKFGAWITDTGLPMLGRFGNWFQTIGVPALKQLGTTVLTNLLPPLQNLFTQVGILIGNFVTWLAKSGLLQTAITDLSGVVGPFINDIANVVAWFNKGGPAVDLVKGALVGLGIAIAGFKGAQMLVEFNKSIGHVIDEAVSMKNTFLNFINWFSNTFALQANTASAKVETSVKGIGTAADTTAMEVEADATKMDASLVGTHAAADGASAGFRGMGSAIGGLMGSLGVLILVEQLAERVANALGVVTGKVGDIQNLLGIAQTFGLGKNPSFTPGQGEVPPPHKNPPPTYGGRHFALGGHANPGETFVAGEAGPEWITAGSGGATITPGSGSHTFILEIDSIQLAQITARATDRLTRLKLGSQGRAA